MLCLFHSDLDDHHLNSSPSQTSSRQSSIEPSQVSISQPLSPLQGFPLKRKRKDNRASEQEVDNLLFKNLMALEEPSMQDDEEELFGRQVAIILRRLTARQRAQAKLKIQSLLVETEFPDMA